MRYHSCVLPYSDHFRSFIDAPFINVKGKPSSTLAKTLEENEQKRLDAQRKELGEEGIKKAKKVLDDAQVENNKDIPEGEYMSR